MAVIAAKSSLHYKLNQKDSSFLYDSYLLKKAKAFSNIHYSANAHFNIALYFKKQGVYDSAFYHYNQSKNFFFTLKRNSKVGKGFLGMALIQQNKNDFFGSKETIVEALQYFNSKKDAKYISSSYSTLATNHRKLLNYSDAIKYYVKAIENTNFKTDKFIYQNNLAATYIDNKQYNAAILKLKSILSDSVLISNKKEYARVLDNLVYARWLNGEAIQIKEFLEPLKIRKQSNDLRGKIASYTHLGEFYSKTNSVRASSYFDSVIQVSKRLKIPRAEKDALSFLMKLEPKDVKIRDRYVFLQDSLYRQELKVKTQFAKYKYDDTVTREANLRLEKENAEKALEVSEQQNQKTLYLGGFLFAVTAFGLSLFGFNERTKKLRQKSKTEKLEAILNTEAEFSLKLHDDHGGKINQIMLMLQRGVKKSIILDALGAFYEDLRNLSRELNEVDTGPDFWKILKATLEYMKPLEVELIISGGKEMEWFRLDHQTKTILSKVLQELIINMGKHSKASQAVVLFKDQQDKIQVYYEDNGIGAPKDSLNRKNGLRNTEKRIKAINGSITFDTEEGKGFRAEIYIPK
ncbi:hypothetical protein NBT05_03480 [Aquimarina sp. ERC-38]|uniref:tetratricopeptide repeat-containing sensor histidine kinase n=1 Tax=Aquimarina sp. ERC-38 TaxID=2949996 RepID=UPI0022458E46|nr:ATP-binding protein [Aquimarina sp. ERC-38]UZO81542.1 hypothetical protein NBT05_03480 [Aquimarina sp. ERC-38]